MKLTAKFSNPLHADDCFSNLQEADFKPVLKKKKNISSVQIKVTKQTKQAAMEIIQDCHPDEFEEKDA
jgi:hypothetical protein